MGQVITIMDLEVSFSTQNIEWISDIKKDNSARWFYIVFTSGKKLQIVYVNEKDLYEKLHSLKEKIIEKWAESLSSKGNLVNHKLKL